MNSHSYFLQFTTLLFVTWVNSWYVWESKKYSECFLAKFLVFKGKMSHVTCFLLVKINPWSYKALIKDFTIFEQTHIPRKLFRRIKNFKKRIYYCMHAFHLHVFPVTKYILIRFFLWQQDYSVWLVLESMLYN